MGISVSTLRLCHHQEKSPPLASRGMQTRVEKDQVDQVTTLGYLSAEFRCSSETRRVGHNRATELN